MLALFRIYRCTYTSGGDFLGMFSISLFLISLYFYCTVRSTDPASEQATELPRLLVLGGNGFMGSSLVAKLISGGKYDVTILNRGTWYFDSKSRIEPFVHRIVCDRWDITSCTQLVNAKYYYAVVDFTSYYGEQIQSVLKVLRNKFGRYVYISSDSVYEVCVPNSHGGPSVEEDAVRPSDPEERRVLNEKDSYGHQKLACEEVLEKERKAHGINYISLRLPDVIGPRDTTNRFWNYQIWLQSQHLLGSLGPVHLHPKNNKPISFVYSEDVAELIVKLLEDNLDVYNQPYNVAFPPITLEEFLEIMADTLGIKDVAFDRTERAKIHWFPSVLRGPINTTKISRVLSWKPSSLKEAVRESCQFYQDAMRVPEYQKRRDKVMKRYLLKKETWNRFLLDRQVDLGLRDEL